MKRYIFFALSVLYLANAEVYIIRYDSQLYFEEFEDMLANFGGKLYDGAIRGRLMIAEPLHACTPIIPSPLTNESTVMDSSKWVVIIARNHPEKNCSFEQKVRNAQAGNYEAAIVYNTRSEQLVPMGAENGTGIVIPAVFVGYRAGKELRKCADRYHYVVITSESPFNIQTHLLIPFAVVVGICFVVMVVFMVVKWFKERRRQRRHRLPTSTLNKIPTCVYQKSDPYDTCAICLDDYSEGEKLRVLPCNHVYHTKCIDPWLTKNRRVCPICKRKVFAHDESKVDTDSDDTDTDDTTPLINNTRGRGRPATDLGTGSGSSHGNDVFYDALSNSNRQQHSFVEAFQRTMRRISQATQQQQPSPSPSQAYLEHADTIVTTASVTSLPVTAGQSSSHSINADIICSAVSEENPDDLHEELSISISDVDSHSDCSSRYGVSSDEDNVEVCVLGLTRDTQSDSKASTRQT